MSEKRVAFVVSGKKIHIVQGVIPGEPDEPITIELDDTWDLPAGDREDALIEIFRHCRDFLEASAVESVIIKASEIGGSTKLVHLESAEVRGVVAAAARSIVPTKFIKQSVVSKTYGKRKVDEYLKDDDFWSDKVAGGKLRKTNRLAAMLLVASRDAE